VAVCVQAIFQGQFDARYAFTRPRRRTLLNNYVGVLTVDGDVGTKKA